MFEIFLPIRISNKSFIFTGTHKHTHFTPYFDFFFFASVSLLSKEFPFIEKCLLSKKKKKHTHILVKVFMKNEANTFWLNIVCMDALDLYCNLKSNQCTILMIRLSVYTHKHKYSTSKSCLDFGFWIWTLKSKETKLAVNEWYFVLDVYKCVLILPFKILKP